MTPGRALEVSRGFFYRGVGEAFSRGIRTRCFSLLGCFGGSPLVRRLWGAFGVTMGDWGGQGF